MMAQQEAESEETAARRIARYELIILRIQFAILQVRREAQLEGLSIDAINHKAMIREHLADHPDQSLTIRIKPLPSHSIALTVVDCRVVARAEHQQAPHHQTDKDRNLYMIHSHPSVYAR